MINLLAISGSLRKISSNTSLLKAAILLAPAGVQISLYDKLGELPHFNPDLQDNEPQVVLDFRKLVADVDGLIICSPEYAHGVPGVMKNALDWLVGSLDFAGKPVMLLNASPRSTYAFDSLKETLTVMAARIIPQASITVSLWGKQLDEQGMIADNTIAESLLHALQEFHNAIRSI